MYTEIFDKVVEIAKKTVIDKNVEVKPSDIIIDDLKISSLDLMILISEIESCFDIYFPDEVLIEISSVDDLVNAILSLKD